MIAYNADDAALYGVLYHYPATYNNTEEEMVQIYDWDSGVSVHEMIFEVDRVQINGQVVCVGSISSLLFSSSFFAQKYLGEIPQEKENKIDKKDYAPFSVSETLHWIYKWICD